MALGSAARMKVGVVCPYDMAAPGGVQQLVTELTEHLRAAGHETVLVGAGKRIHDEGAGRDGSIIPTGRPISVFGNQSRVPLTLSPLSWRRVRSALRDVDVVHLHEPLLPLVGWAAMGAGKPTVATFHADAPDWARRAYRVIPGLSRRLGRYVITAVSRTAAAAIPKKWGEVVIVPNALDVASYRLEVGRIARRIAFLGRDDPRKGLDVLLEAWPQIRRRVADAELVVMGASRDKPIDGVSFRGWVSEGEKRRLLATSAVYVAPHLGGESFGIVIAEAMAAGCAVVATDLPAFREVMRNTGVVVAPGDVVGLTAAVAGVLDDPDRVAELGERARAAVARFDWSSVLDQYLAVYRRAIGL